MVVVNMKKLTFAVIVALPIVQILLASLKLLGVVSMRWLWVLTPLWLFLCCFALYGIYVSIKNGNERTHHNNNNDNDHEENK